jgi:multiple sugar transport system substrate-binding protein
MLKLTTAAAAATVGGRLLSPYPASGAAPAVIKGKKLTIWFGQSFLEAIDKKLGSLFQEFGKEKGVEIDFIITPSAQLPQRLAAAIQGKNPPDICYQYDSDTQYYRGQNQLVEVTEVWSALKKKGGDVYQAAEATISWENKAWSIPMAINPWPMHSRKDLLDKAALKYPANWDEFIETCKKIQKPPQLYGYGPCLGKNDDTNCNVIHIMWTFGAQIQTKDNKPAFNTPETRKAFQLIADMYLKHKIVPPGAINWDNAGNNNAYQSEQCAFIQNPASVLAWCQVNKPQLAEATLLANLPSGPAGSFGMVDCWAMSIFKDSKAQDAAKEALAYVMEPDRYDGFIQMAAGRYVPVFKKLTNTKFWKESKFYHTYPGLAETGRILAFAGQPTAAFGEVMRGYILADALQAVIVQGVSVDNAVNEADKKIQAIYKKHGFI